MEIYSGFEELTELLTQYASDDDPTTWFKGMNKATGLLAKEAGLIGEMIAGTTTISEAGALGQVISKTGFAIPMLFCGLSEAAWSWGVETKEWKEFVAENEGNLPSAFVEAFAGGVVKCAVDLPRELYNIFTDGYISEERYKEMSALDFLLAVVGQLIPMPGTNVYKPNIYLYSDEPLEVQVEFLQENLLTETIPEYSLGWDALI